MAVQLSPMSIGYLLLHRLPSSDSNLIHGVHFIFIMLENSYKWYGMSIPCSRVDYIVYMVILLFIYAMKHYYFPCKCWNIVTLKNILNLFYCCNLSEMFYSSVRMLLLYLFIVKSWGKISVVSQVHRTLQNIILYCFCVFLGEVGPVILLGPTC